MGSINHCGPPRGATISQKLPGTTTFQELLKHANKCENEGGTKNFLAFIECIETVQRSSEKIQKATGSAGIPKATSGEGKGALLSFAKCLSSSLRATKILAGLKNFLCCVGTYEQGFKEDKTWTYHNPSSPFPKAPSTVAQKSLRSDRLQPEQHKPQPRPVSGIYDNVEIDATVTKNGH